jgi:hypothetical protein
MNDFRGLAAPRTHAGADLSQRGLGLGKEIARLVQRLHGLVRTVETDETAGLTEEGRQRAFASRMCELAAIHVPSVRDPRDHDETLCIIDGVDDPVVADPDAVVVAPGELRRAARPRVPSESVDRLCDALEHRAVQTPIRANRRRMETNLVDRLSRSLLPDVRPRHGELELVAGLEGGETIFEVVEAVEQLGIPIDVDEHAGEAAALRHV